MRAKLDVTLTRQMVKRIYAALEKEPSAPSVTVGVTVDVASVDFRDDYTKLVSGTEICETTALVRCKY